MGLFSRKQVFQYRLFLSDCVFRSFDDIAAPFFAACKAYGFKPSMEPIYCSYGVYMIDFMNSTSGDILLKNNGASIRLEMEFSKDAISEESQYREAIKKIYLATMQELVNEYSFTYAATISDDKERYIENPWEITPKKTYM